MWRAYAEQFWPQSDDLKSSIQRLRCDFEALSFEYSHDYNYKYFDLSPDELISYKEFEKIYDEAEEVCLLYLQDEISLECLCYELTKLGLQSKINTLKNFLPTHLREKFCGSC